MGIQYQQWDQGLIDYQLWKFHDLNLRGPSRGGPDSIAFVGAAQTFGRFCRDPFPAILGRRLAVRTLNFGVGGKGPSFFRESQPIIDKINESALVVVQVTSARSVTNSLFETNAGGRDGIRRTDQKCMTAEEVYRHLCSRHNSRGELGLVDRFFAETRRNYLNEMISLLSASQPRKILFWFSVRSPGHNSPLAFNTHTIVDVAKHCLARLGLIPRFEYVGGHFPHLVDQETINQLMPLSDAYIECVTSEGLPQILVNWHRNRLIWNNYYPTAAMHKKAAEMLFPSFLYVTNYSVKPSHARTMDSPPTESQPGID